MNWSIDQVGHLVRRFVGSVSRRQPEPADTAWVDSQLLASESLLWHRMSAADRRHSIAVAHRFEKLGGQWSREEMAGALLHDIGKLESGLGTLARVSATVVGPRTPRFRRYHDHEQIGADMLAAAGSSEVTVELVLGRGRAGSALRQADQI
jgi:putative nucleotidyltransferase with HDIG domain